MTEENKCILGDSAIELKKLESNSIDLTVTSPPYDTLRQYGGYSFDFETIAKELFRVTKDGGVVVWVIGDETKDGDESGTSFKHALKFKEYGFKLWDTMIFQKNQYPPNCMSQNRYAQVFEYMFVFSKGKVKTFNRLMRKNKLAGQKKANIATAVVQRNGEVKRYGRNRSLVYHNETVERNIWIYNVGGASGTKSKNHPAVFPEQLVRDHILSWSNENDVVLDPFAGSGTTLKVAKDLKRKYIGIELNPDYYNIILENVKEWR